MAWTTPRTWSSGELVTASMMNSHVRDNLNAIVAGMVGVGFVEIDLLGTGSAPSVSTASHATLYYHTTNGLQVSINGGAYTALSGTPPWAEPTIISQWAEVVRKG